MTGHHDHTHSHHAHDDDEMQRWKHDGVRVIPGDQLDPNVPSTPGMDRKAAINFARAGAKKLWAGTEPSSRMLRPAPIITATWRASFTWCVARRACAGASSCNLPP